MVTQEVLCSVFSEIGKGFGFDKVQAEFMAFKEMKVRWQRSYKWAEFKVSDYLEDAPEDVIRGLGKSLFSKILGNDGDSFSDDMCNWVTSPDFASAKQQTYIRRSRNMTRSFKGQFKDLSDSYRRLSEAGLINEDPQIHISWMRESHSRKVGSCSVLMKVVSLSKHLDSESIPDFVIDYCLYHELCHILVGFDPTGKGHGSEFAALELRFKMHDEAEDWLKNMGLYL